MLRLHPKHGQLCKQVTLKVFIPGKRPVIHNVRAKRGHWINEVGLESILDQEVENLEKNLPQYEFRMIEIVPNHFNFVGQEKTVAA